MLKAMARMAPSQPNEAMAHISPRSSMVPMVNIKISLDSKSPSKVQIDPKRGLG
jgi:hypothetical protein